MKITLFIILAAYLSFFKPTKIDEIQYGYMELVRHPRLKHVVYIKHTNYDNTVTLYAPN